MKALSQDVMLLAIVPLFARSRVSGQHDVGHEGVITGCDAFNLRSSISLIPKESPGLHSNQLIHMIYVLLKVLLTFDDEQVKVIDIEDS
ncbi:hypothetical protein ACQKMI_02435 [Lysinibacillus sp. NPDC097214]|uniref:hypothetical protein n=1 Tax=Lysinibacillus sp. NPDC097214 TaxID=3390584 RepID=UPI003D002E44